VIDVYGTIIDVEEKGSILGDSYEITLDAGILAYVDCRFDLIHKDSLLSLQRGQTVTVRGKVSRGNPAWVKMTKCIIPNNQ
jgi:hypothetical protein